jgi:hypothetical protein
VEVTKEIGGKKFHLAYLGKNATIGEMSMVDNKPRSASVTAIKNTVAREIHRDSFFENLNQHPEIAINLLKTLLERLREANMTILNLQSGKSGRLFDLRGLENSGGEPESPVSVTLQGLTPKAVMSLGKESYVISKFPFRIGREVPDPLVYNDLKIADAAPLQISRHHVSFLKADNKIGVFDRGSHLGASINGSRIGGRHGGPGPVYFQSGEGTMVLGTDESPFRYKVIVKSGG